MNSKKLKATKEVAACVVDTGGNYVSVASRLAREYKTVYYCNPSWQDSYPKMNKPAIGQGIEGIEVVESIFDVYDEIDLWVFPDVFFGSLQEWLVSQGEVVWGSRSGEELELQRDDLKAHMDALGLPVNKYQSIKGITNLRLYLEENKNVWVKINKWRGTVETFYSENYQLIKPELDEMQYSLGIFSEEIDFIVENPIDDAVEVGYDGWTIDGEYPVLCLSGVEIKDKAYAGEVKAYKDLSPLVTGFNDKMSETFKGYGFRSFFSTEIRVDKNKTPYMIDFTARVPCPPGEIYQELYKNYGEIIWAGANGEMVIPQTTAKYAVELLIESEWAVKSFQPVYFPEEVAPYVKLKKNKIGDGVNYIIPQLFGSSDIGAVVGLGDTLELAINQCLYSADQISGNGISMRKDTLNDAQGELDKFDKIK